MSLIAFAVRVCMVKALMGQTLAGDAVDDSPIDPIDVVFKRATPSIAIFTDTETLRPDGRSIIEGERTQDITLHIFLPTKLEFNVNGQTFDFEGRSSGASLVIDAIYRQIELVLMSGTSVWAHLFRQFVNGYKEVDAKSYVLTTTSSIAGQGANTGVRVPAREILYRCDTIFSPPIGAVPEGPWAELVAALQADDETAGLGPLVTGLITGLALPQWRQDQAELGATIGEMAGLGLGPLGGGATDDVVPIVEVDIDDRTDTPDPLQVLPAT